MSVMSVVLDGRRSPVDLVTPLAFSHKSDQRLKVESVCSLQRAYSRFQFNLSIKLSIVLPDLPTNPPLHSHAHQVSQVNSRGEAAGRRATKSPLCPAVGAEPAQHIGRKGEKYILQPFDE